MAAHTSSRSSHTTGSSTSPPSNSTFPLQPHRSPSTHSSSHCSHGASAQLLHSPPLPPSNSPQTAPTLFYVQSPSRDSSVSTTTTINGMNTANNGGGGRTSDCNSLMTDIPIHHIHDDATNNSRFSSSSAPSSPLLYSFFHDHGHGHHHRSSAIIGEPLHQLFHNHPHHMRGHGHHTSATVTSTPLASPDLSSNCTTTSSLRLSLHPPRSPGMKRAVPHNWAPVVDEESIGDFSDAGGEYGRRPPPAYGACDLHNRKLLFFWCRMYAIALICTVLCSFLLMWLACTPPGSPATVQDISFLYFTLIHGSDRSLVPTDMLLVDSNVTINFHNPSKYFHLHFHRTLLTFSYMEIPIARGKVLSFELNHRSTESMLVKMNSEDAPLYGAGIDFEESGDEVTVRLDILMEIRVSILWNALRRKFVKDTTCDFELNVATLALLNLTCN